MNFHNLFKNRAPKNCSTDCWLEELGKMCIPNNASPPSSLSSRLFNFIPFRNMMLKVNFCENIILVDSASKLKMFSRKLFSKCLCRRRYQSCTSSKFGTRVLCLWNLHSNVKSLSDRFLQDTATPNTRETCFSMNHHVGCGIPNSL